MLQEECSVMPTWLLREGNSAYYYDSEVTYKLAAWLTPTYALSIAQSFTDTEETVMSYFVRGLISNMRNTPEQIMQYQSARFDISNDGTSTDQLYCYNTRWLNNTDYITGEELSLGNEVVVLGALQNYNGTTPEIKGYIYEHHEESTQRDYSITSLTLVSIEDMKVTFAWESAAPMVEVRLLNAKNKQIGKLYTSDKEVSFKAPEMGTYTVCVRPVDEDKQYLADEVRLVIEVVPTAIEDIATETVRVEKVVKDGQLLIIRNGEVFNVMGAKTR